MQLKQHIREHFREPFFGCVALASPSALAAPLVGLDKIVSLKIIKRNPTHSNLPHMNQKYHYQFIAFRTKESTDKFIQKLLDTRNIKTRSLLEVPIKNNAKKAGLLDADMRFYGLYE